jgi:glycosyltransferase involved in cell wall biosynthesis
MKIGIDISQLAYSNTGVANYLQNLLQNLLALDKKNEYILFYSSLRRKLDDSMIKSFINSRVHLKKIKFPPILLDFLWNKLHVAPIEWFIGDVDVFITSDWTEPPVKKAKKVTILYDLIVYKYPQETTAKIIRTQKSKLKWVRKESDAIFCISESTKKDAIEILNIEESRLHVIYPGR